MRRIIGVLAIFTVCLMSVTFAEQKAKVAPVAPELQLLPLNGMTIELPAINSPEGQNLGFKPITVRNVTPRDLPQLSPDAGITMEQHFSGLGPCNRTYDIENFNNFHGGCSAIAWWKHVRWTGSGYTNLKKNYLNPVAPPHCPGYTSVDPITLAPQWYAFCFWNYAGGERKPELGLYWPYWSASPAWALSPLDDKCEINTSGAKCDLALKAKAMFYGFTPGITLTIFARNENDPVVGGNETYDLMWAAGIPPGFYSFTLEADLTSKIGTNTKWAALVWDDFPSAGPVTNMGFVALTLDDITVVDN